MGQRITGLAEGAIESMHNLPVSLAGSKLSDGINGSEAAIHEVPEFTGGVNAEEAAVAEIPEYTGPLATVGEEPAPMVENQNSLVVSMLLRRQSMNFRSSRVESMQF